MQAVRQRATAGVARCVRKANARSYASEHGHGHGHDAHHGPVNESFGPGFYGFIASVPAGILLYNLAQPGKDGSEPALTQWLNKGFWEMQDEWEKRNRLHEKAVQQAGFDRTLFHHAGGTRFVDVKTPELINSYACANIPAGHILNMDHVTEHFRQKHLEEEERKAKKLAAAAEKKA